MEDLVKRMAELLGGTEPWVLVLAAAVVLLALLFWVLRKPLRVRRDRNRIRRAVEALGDEVMSNLVIPNGLDGYTFIEHLVRAPDRLRVVSVQREDGAIFGAEKMDMWAQVTGRGSYKFPNPLREVEDAIVALRALVPEVEVDGTVIFDRGASFPKGKPAGVLHISEIAEEKKADPGEGRSPEAVREGWGKLRQFQQRT